MNRANGNADNKNSADNTQTGNATKPHIVMVVGDDIGWNNVGWHAKDNEAASEVSTPVLDSLVAEGIQLERHIAFKYCSPSRCALYSGRNPIHVNVDNAVFAANTGIPENMTCIASRLRATGYRTIFAGKWHAGARTWGQTPRGRGFGASLSYFNPDNDYWSSVYGGCPLSQPGIAATPIIDLWEGIEGGGEGPARYLANQCPYEGRFVPMNGCANVLGDKCASLWNTATVSRNKYDDCVTCGLGAGGEECSMVIIERWCQGYINYSTGFGCHTIAGSSPVFEDDLFVDYTVKKVMEHPAAPLFLVFASHAAHVPLQAPEETLSRFDFIANRSDKLAHSRQIYTAIVAELDAQIGRIVDALRAKDMWDSTLFVFVSDNGGPIYFNGTSGANNYPLRGGKMSNYEGGIRVAAFLSGGFIPVDRRGATYPHLIAIWDWYAILGSVAGVEGILRDRQAESAGLPGVDAVDLSASLFENTSDAPTRTVLAIGSANRSMSLVAGVFWERWSNSSSTIYKLLLGPQNQGVLSSPLSPNGTMNATLYFPRNDSMLWIADVYGYDCGDAGCLFDVAADPSETTNLASKMPHVVSSMMRLVQQFRASSFVKEIGNTEEAACIAAAGFGNVWGPWAASLT